MPSHGARCVESGSHAVHSRASTPATRIITSLVNSVCRERAAEGRCIRVTRPDRAHLTQGLPHRRGRHRYRPHRRALRRLVVAVAERAVGCAPEYPRLPRRLARPTRTDHGSRLPVLRLHARPRRPEPRADRHHGHRGGRPDERRRPSDRQRERAGSRRLPGWGGRAGRAAAMVRAQVIVATHSPILRSVIAGGHALHSFDARPISGRFDDLEHALLAREVLNAPPRFLGGTWAGLPPTGRSHLASACGEFVELQRRKRG